MFPRHALGTDKPHIRRHVRRSWRRRGGAYRRATDRRVSLARGLAATNAYVAVNGNEAYRAGDYFFGSDDFDNSTGGGFAELEVSAVVNAETNDFVSVVTNRVFVPPASETYAYDADGNQTLVTTGTGVWQVEYNGENRPVRWMCDDRVLHMAYDHQGRRRLYVEIVGGVTNSLHRFTYDDYLCVARNREMDLGQGAGVDGFIWDPTEPVATRPLMSNPSTAPPFLYCHDGNKNVSEIVDVGTGEISAHHEYSAFGKMVLVTSERGGNVAAINPYRFSSEYHDDALGLVYYNFRHYDMHGGRWLCRDPIGEFDGKGLIAFLLNSPLQRFDVWGLFCYPTIWGGVSCYPNAPTPNTPTSSGPSVFDHLPWSNPVNESRWFESRYPNTINAAKEHFSDGVSSGVDCENGEAPSAVAPFMVEGGLQPVFPPWASDNNAGDTISQFGDAPQTSWERWAQLGNFSFTIDNININFGDCIDSVRSYRWTANMSVVDGLGLDPNDGWPYRILGSIFPNRNVKRATWRISGEGECSCCDMEVQ